ncbi:MAG: response regulator [Candidatus Omnitrophica bacterium]|nr:response regulator [Candidatus Omnitrophota bacterium]
MAGEKKIFVADDDEIVFTGLKRLLELSGFNVHGCQKSNEVVAVIKATNPDVIILDLLMPGLSGFDICAQLNNDPQTQGIPIIVTSALAAYTDIKKAYQLGIVSYFTKPYDFQKLLEEIKEIIASKNAGGPCL